MAETLFVLGAVFVGWAMIVLAILLFGSMAAAGAASDRKAAFLVYGIVAGVTVMAVWLALWAIGR